MKDRTHAAPAATEADRLWSIIRTIIAERDAYAAENDRLGALLLENHRWRVEIANAFVAGFREGAALDSVVAALAGRDVDKRAALGPAAGGGSLWLRRLAG